MQLTYKHHPFRGLVVHMKTAGTGENAKTPGTGQARENAPVPSRRKGKLKTLANDPTTTQSLDLATLQQVLLGDLRAENTTAHSDCRGNDALFFYSRFS